MELLRQNCTGLVDDYSMHSRYRVPSGHVLTASVLLNLTPSRHGASDRGLRWKELFGPSSGSRLVGVAWISTLVPVALRATRVEGDCRLGLCSILRRRALGAGGVRPMVDHTLGVPAGFFRL